MNNYVVIANSMYTLLFTHACTCTCIFDINTCSTIVLVVMIILYCNNVPSDCLSIVSLITVRVLGMTNT